MSYAVENATCARCRTSGGPCVPAAHRGCPAAPARAGDLLDRFGQPPAIVGEIDRDRRGARRDDAEHVAFVHELVGDLLEQLADAPGVAEVEVQVVDEDEEDAAGRIAGRPRRRQEDAFRDRRGGGAAML